MILLLNLFDKIEGEYIDISTFNKIISENLLKVNKLILMITIITLWNSSVKSGYETEYKHCTKSF
jgi:hypothetical protein